MQNKYCIKLLFLCIAFSFASCSSDDDPTSEQPPAVVSTALGTNGPYFNADNSGLRINAVVYTPGTNLLKVGICISTSPGPTVANDTLCVYYHDLQDHFFDLNKSDQFGYIRYSLAPEATYYVRAFALSSNVIEPAIYGNEISFTMPAPTLTADPGTIEITRMILPYNDIRQGPYVFEQGGYIYSQQPNITADNGIHAAVTTMPDNSYRVIMNNLEPDTTYYYNTYSVIDGVTYYGQEKQFKTVGSTGPGGGIIALFKDNTYYEIYPQTLTFNPAIAQGAEWGVSENILGVEPEGGPSEVIAANVESPNCAAKLCLDFENNGFSDWYLGSPNEMFDIVTSLYYAGNLIQQGIWTSGENAGYNEYNQPATWARYVQMQIGYIYPVSSSATSKDSTMYVLPLRKYTL